MIVGVPESQTKTSLIELIGKGETNPKNRNFDLAHKSVPLLPYDPIMSDLLLTISQSIKGNENWPLSQNRNVTVIRFNLATIQIQKDEIVYQ